MIWVHQSLSLQPASLESCPGKAFIKTPAVDAKPQVENVSELRKVESNFVPV